MGKTVYLSPSTQEKNIGVGNYGTEEQEMNKVADVTQKELERHGVKVYRNNPDWILGKVVEDSNEKKPDIHFAIHSNAGGGRGCEAYCHKFGGEGEKLARAVYAELSPLTPTSDRGVMEGCNMYGPGKPMYELANTIAPAALVEVAYHDDPSDAKWIMANIEVIGTAIAKGILKYFNIPYQEVSPNNDINILQKYGIINSPDYWLKNAVKGKTIAGENAAILIKRTAALLLKGGK